MTAKHYRYHHGQTTNPAFEHFWIALGYLDTRCHELIDTMTEGK